MDLRLTATRAGACLVVYAALAIWLTWPLGAYVATHLPATTSLLFDTIHTAWVLSWETHSLTTAPSTLPDANIYFPTINALFYGQTAFGALPYFAPVFLASGNPTLALNVMFLGGVALTACSLHLVVHHWTRSHVAGAIAAWTFLTTRWVLWEVVPTAPQYALLHFFPLILLLAMTPARRFPLGLLALVVLQALVDPVYLGAGLLIPLGLLAAGRLARADTREAGIRLAAVVASAAVALFVAFASHLLVRAANPNLAQQTVWTVPMPPIAFPWGLVSCPAPTAAPSAFLLLIVAGAASAVIAGSEAPARRAWAHVALWTAVGVALSLKPPTFPIGEMLRVPARNGIAALIGIALLAGLAFAECGRRLAAWGRFAPLVLAAMVAVAGYVEHRHGLADPSFQRPPLPPYGLARMPVLEPPLLDAVGRASGPLLELPLGDGQQRFALLNARAMYRSIFHWRPLVNGYDGYFPADFPRRVEFASRLPDAAALRALAEATELQTILVNTEDLTPDDRAVWTGIADAGRRDDLRLVQRDGTRLLFAVTVDATKRDSVARR